jgi:hypothetical protein
MARESICHSQFCSIKAKHVGISEWPAYVADAVKMYEFLGGVFLLVVD